MKVGWIRNAGRAAVLALLLVAPQGCAYLQDRGDDAAEMIDIGVTWTSDPCFSLNLCLLGLASIGGGYMDGGFAGLGGGRGGIQRHYHNGMGLLLWSYDEWAWGDYDIDDPQTLDAMYIGPVGWAQHPERRPDYAFAWLKYFHVGYVGLVLNFRFVEIFDFFGGLATADLAGDDGDRNNDWSWYTGEERGNPVPRSDLRW